MDWKIWAFVVIHGVQCASDNSEMAKWQNASNINEKRWHKMHVMIVLKRKCAFFSLAAAALYSIQWTSPPNDISFIITSDFTINIHACTMYMRRKRKDDSLCDTADEWLNETANETDHTLHTCQFIGSSAIILALFCLLFIRNGILMWLYWDGFLLHFLRVIPFNLCAIARSLTHSLPFPHSDANFASRSQGIGLTTMPSITYWQYQQCQTASNNQINKPTKQNKTKRSVLSQTAAPQPIKINISIDK